MILVKTILILGVSILPALSMDHNGPFQDPWCKEHYGELRKVHWDSKHVSPEIQNSTNAGTGTSNLRWTSWSRPDDAWRSIDALWIAGIRSSSNVQRDPSNPNRLVIKAPLDKKMAANENKGFERDNNYIVTNSRDGYCDTGKLVIQWNEKDKCWDLITCYPTGWGK